MEHLREQLLETHVGAPVYAPKIVAVVEVPMVKKLLARAREAGGAVSTD
jgi:hypothetical protein